MAEEEEAKGGEEEAAPEAAPEAKAENPSGLPDLNLELKYQMARARVREIKSFYVHTVLFVIFNVGLFVLNLQFHPTKLWFYIPLSIWAVAWIGHAFCVYSLGGLWGFGWERKKIAKLLNKEAKLIEKAESKAAKKKAKEEKKKNKKAKAKKKKDKGDDAEEKEE